MFSKIVLIFERVGDGCYHSYLFNIRSVGITVVDRELTLVSLRDFVELAVAICCKLLCWMEDTRTVSPTNMWASKR